MKVQLIGHATVLIKDKKFSFICDPWLVGDYVNNCTVWQYPPREFGIEKINKFKYIYISHDHEDHCNAETLAKINKNTKIFIMKFKENRNLIRRLKSMKFKNIIEVEPWEKKKIDNNTHITIFPSDQGFVDSSALIQYKDLNIYHGNDCILYPNTIKKISKLAKIDIAFMPYAGFSGFPSSYEFSYKIKKKLAEKKKREGLKSFYEAVKLLNPQKAVPAAGDLIIVGKGKAWINYFDRASPLEAIRKAPLKIKSKLVDMRPGDTFTKKNGIKKFRKVQKWKYNTQCQEKFYAQPYVKKEVEKYNNWILNLKINNSNFNKLVLNFFKKSLKKEIVNKLKNYKFQLISDNKNKSLKIILLIDFGKKKIIKLNKPSNDYTKKIIVDAFVLCRIIRHEILWGDAYCGLFMKLHRKPTNNYNLNFWRWFYSTDELKIPYKNYFKT
tara:strand:- start:2903 stop:4222 length:1320 start_codon:yes stop_codon:yes gene_type:complete